MAIACLLEHDPAELPARVQMFSLAVADEQVVDLHHRLPWQVSPRRTTVRKGPGRPSSVKKV